MENSYRLGSIITLKKPHPSKTIEWKIIRTGIDIKLQSLANPKLHVMMTRIQFQKWLREVVTF